MSLYSKIMECGGYFNKNVRGISKPILIAGILFPIAFAANLFPLYLQRQAKIEEKCMEEYRTVLERMVKENADTNRDGSVDNRENEKFFNEYLKGIEIKELAQKFNCDNICISITSDGQMYLERLVPKSPSYTLHWVAAGITPKDKLEIIHLVEKKVKHQRGY